MASGRKIAAAFLDVHSLTALVPVLAMMSTGCPKVEPINSKPVAVIGFSQSAPAAMYIGESWELSAKSSSDPDGDSLTYTWRLSVCPPGLDCEAPFDSSIGMTRGIDFVKAGHLPLAVTLIVEDSRHAKAEVTKVYQATNRNPTVALKRPEFLANRNGNVTVGRELSFTASKSDLDGDPVTLTWKLVGQPAGASPQERAGSSDETHFVRPDRAGDWVLRVTATDAFGGSGGSDDVPFKVEEDLPPCIETRDPAAPAGLPVIVARSLGPRSFRVETVDDEFNAFPFPTVSDDRTGEASFRWSIGKEGSVPVEIPGQRRNTFILDASGYRLGDRLSLRVDVLDAQPRSCPAEASTCALIADKPQCLQRYTWTVEVR